MKTAEAAKPKDPLRRGPCAAESHRDYLTVLGERVRNARARRGMTRKSLARDSGVSERYLAQLEAGQGNISIALLRQVAQAMSVPIADLVREGAEHPIELALLLQRLERLAPGDLAAAHRLVSERFGATEPGDRTARIALIGLRGAGKTTLGRRLAGALDMPFVEMAAEIERDSGMSLNEIFSLSGQAAYRRYERRTLENVLKNHPQSVIATGGGLVSEPATFELMLNGCFTIWVKAAPEEHMARVIAQGDMRPMSGNGNGEAMDDLRRILAGRDALYARADAEIDTTGQDVEKSFQDLYAVVQAARAANQAANQGADQGRANKQNNA